MLLRKSAVAVVLALLAMMAFAGCVVVSFTDYNSEMETGRGPMVEKRFETAPYTEVEIDANLAVVYSKEPSDAVVVEIQENLAEFLNVEVRDGVLTVSAERTFMVTNAGDMPILYVFAPELVCLRAGGAFEFRGGDVVSGERFTLYAAGSADINMDLDVRTLELRLSGASRARLSGAAEEARIQASGACELNALDLETVRAVVDINGAGSAAISCSETLDASLSGVASLKYRGEPVMTTSIQGAGSIQAAE
jgi:hypothetical protein